MPKQKVTCPVCKQEVEIEEGDKIQACYGIGHKTISEVKRHNEKHE